MPITSKVIRPLVTAEISRITFIPTRFLRSDDKLRGIGITSALKKLLSDKLKARLLQSNIILDVPLFDQGVRAARTVDEVARAVARASSVAPGGPIVTATVATVARIRDVTTPEARKAVVTSMKLQLSWAGAISDSAKLSKWAYTPIMRAQLCDLINNHFNDKLVPPMALSHITTADYVSEIIVAVDEKRVGD